MANLTDRPVPARPSRFAADGVPDGPRFQARTNAFGTWAASRPKIKPRTGVVHTNAASQMSSVAGQINWGNAAANNTKPHWVVADGVAVKTLATDRRGIANSTGSSVEDQYGERDSAYWSYAIETRDTGYKNDPGISDFVDDDAELVATILAYEAVTHGHPIVIPDRWNAPGVVTHTWPFPYPYFTTVRGKTCPGEKKKRTFREQIVPRAAQIVAAWTGIASDNLTGDDDMTPIPATIVVDTRRGIGLPDQRPAMLEPDTPIRLPVTYGRHAVELSVDVVQMAHPNGVLYIAPTRDALDSTTLGRAVTWRGEGMYAGAEGTTYPTESGVYVWAKATCRCHLVVAVTAHR